MQSGCPNCGRLLEGHFEKCPHCNYDLTDLHKMIDKFEEERKLKIPKYAGFIQRTVAKEFDLLLITVLFIIIFCFCLKFNFKLIFNYNFWHNYPYLLIIAILCIIIFYFFYCVFCHYSKNLATYGERIVGIKVVDAKGLPLSYKEAFKHNLYKIINILTLGIGYLFIIFSKNKQSLSNMLTHTYVINEKIENNELYYANVISRFIAYIIDIALLWLFANITLFLIPSYVISAFNLGPLLKIWYICFLIIVLVILFFYFPFMESRKGATFGKMAMNIKVADYNGEKISFIKSLTRIFISILENIIIFGTIICLVSPKKQTLKDMITKTVVIQK